MRDLLSFAVGVQRPIVDEDAHDDLQVPPDKRIGVLEDVDVPEKVDEVPWDGGLGQKDGASELEDVVGPVPKMELADVVVVLVVEDGVGPRRG